jgi:hypothetical protein
MNAYLDEESRSINEPAFPPMHDPATHPSGMTLRDYFAGQALLIIAAMPDKLRVQRAYEIADAMLAERSKR